MWTNSCFERLALEFANRKQSGFVRECHGYMHSGNVGYWNEQFVPFDGIEFNEAFRWIDVPPVARQFVQFASRLTTCTVSFG